MATEIRYTEQKPAPLGVRLVRRADIKEPADHPKNLETTERNTLSLDSAQAYFDAARQEKANGARADRELLTKFREGRPIMK